MLLFQPASDRSGRVSVSDTRAYWPGIGAAAGVATVATLLATVWSDVPAMPSVGFEPGGYSVGKTFSW